MINTTTGEVFDIITQNENGEYVVAEQACDMIVSFETQMSAIKKQYADYREALKEAMEEHGIESIKTDDFIVGYIAESERISLDSKAVEKKFPDVYYDPDCQKISSVKSSVRVKLKK